MITRRKLIKSGLFGFGAIALSKSSLVRAASAGYGIKGRVAPELKVNYWIDRNGKPTGFRLSEHEQKWVFLKCFQSWCPGCHAHGFPALKKISDALSDNPRIAFAAIQTAFEGRYVNTADKVREIQLQYDLRLPMGHDPGGINGRPYTMTDYRTGGTPWMILINPERQVVFNDYSINVDRVIEFLVKQTT